MLEELDDSTSTADYKAVGQFTSADEKVLLEAFKDAKDKSPQDIYDLLIDHCRDDFEKCSAATLKKIFRLSLNVYLAFVLPGVVTKLPWKVSTVLARRAAELLKEKTITGSREDLPISLILAHVMQESSSEKQVPEPFISVALQRMSEELLDKNTSNQMRYRLWEALDFLSEENIERGLKLWVKLPGAEKSECLLYSTLPKSLYFNPQVELVLAKIHFHDFVSAITLEQLMTYLREQLAKASENNLEQLQLLMVYLLRGKSEHGPAIVGGMLHQCMLHAMTYSEPWEGLRLSPRIVREYLHYFERYATPNSIRTVLSEWPAKHRYTVLSYLRRTIKNFNAYPVTNAYIARWDYLSRMQLTDTELRDEVRLGHIDVQSWLGETVKQTAFDEKRAQRWVDVGDANLDLHQDYDSSFFELALQAAGRACEPTDKLLDFYLKNTLKKGTTPTALVTRYLERIVSNASLFPAMNSARGIIRLIQKLCAAHEVRVSPELIQRVRDLPIPDDYKQPVLAAITTPQYKDQGLPPIPDEPIVAEIRAISNQSSASISVVLWKHLDALSESTVMTKKILRLSLNVYFAMLLLFKHEGLAKKRRVIASELAAYMFQLYCAGKIRYVQNEMPDELVSFLVRDRMSELIREPVLIGEDQFGSYYYLRIDQIVDNFNAQLCRTLRPGEPEHLEKLQLLIGFFVERLRHPEHKIRRNLYMNRLMWCLLHLRRFSFFLEELKLSPVLLRQCLTYLNSSFGLSVLELRDGVGTALLAYVRRTIGDLTEFPVIDAYCREHARNFNVFACQGKEAAPVIEKGWCDIQGLLREVAHETNFHELKVLHLLACGANLDTVQDGESFYSIALAEAGNPAKAQTDKIQFYLQRKVRLSGPTDVLGFLVKRLMRGYVSPPANDCENYFMGYLYVIRVLIKDYGARVTPEMVAEVRDRELMIVNNAFIAISYTNYQQLILTELESALAFDPFRDCKVLERLRGELGLPDNYVVVNALVEQLGESLTHLTPYEKKQLCEHPVGIDRREFLMRIDDDFSVLFDRKVAIEALVTREAQRLRTFQNDDGALDESKLPNRGLFF